MATRLTQPMEMLLYTPYSMMWALWFLYIVFMIGPIYHSMQRIDEDVMSAAAVWGPPRADLFSGRRAVNKPGLMAGALFVVVLGLAEFFTERVIGGAQNPMLAGLILSADRYFAVGVGRGNRGRLTVLTLITSSSCAIFRSAHVQLREHGIMQSRFNPATVLSPISASSSGTLLPIRHHGGAVFQGPRGGHTFPLRGVSAIWYWKLFHPGHSRNIATLASSSATILARSNARCCLRGLPSSRLSWR